MAKYHRAEDVFKDLPKHIKLKIFDVAAGMLVYFPKNHSRKRILNPEDVLIRYAKSKKSYSQIGDELGVSKVRIYQIVKQERARFSKEKVDYWKKRGLSLRKIARLYRKSHEAVR